MTDHSFTEILLPFKWIKLEWQNLLLSVYFPTKLHFFHTHTGCIDRIRALFGSLWYKDVRFYKNYNFFCKGVSLYASIHLWVCDDKAIFSWDMDDFVHGVSSKVRPIGVQIEQKRLCTLCSKCYHGTHNDPRLLKFSTHILLLDSFAIKKF